MKLEKLRKLRNYAKKNLLYNLILFGILFTIASSAFRSVRSLDGLGFMSFIFGVPSFFVIVLSLWLSFIYGLRLIVHIGKIHPRLGLAGIFYLLTMLILVGMYVKLPEDYYLFFLFFYFFQLVADGLVLSLPIDKWPDEIQNE